MKKNVALLVRLEAKPGKEKEVADFIRSGLALVQEEPDTITWYGVQFGPSSFGIFDTFPHDEGRKTHLAGKVGQALMPNASNLLVKDPEIIYSDILAVKSEEVLESKEA